MQVFWAGVFAQVTLTTILGAFAIWGLVTSERARKLWFSERSTRARQSAACTCGAYHQ
jgi:hypothetical protein